MIQPPSTTSTYSSTREHHTEDLILSCQTPVSRIAHKYARENRCISCDDLYMAGMTEVCAQAERAHRSTTDPLAYLYRVAQYTMIDELTAARQECSHVSLDAPLSGESAYCLADLLGSPCGAPTTGVPLQPVRALRQALLRLPRRERAVLTRLYEFSGCNRYAEVGRELGIRCASTYATRGRQHLRSDAALCQALGVTPEIKSSQKGGAPMWRSAQYVFEEDVEEQADFPLLMQTDEDLAAPDGDGERLLSVPSSALSIMVLERQGELL